VLDFLGTQGNTQVLSSPRIATMNNQKAVLKVGTDDFFVTSISSTTTAVGNTTATTPNIGVQPFFSGISLDVTPNIDANGFITLHVHPSVSSVSERTKVINLGTQGSYSLPLASSEINESDAVVRAYDGNIIAIGGLMRQASVNSDSGVPGTEGSGVFRKLLGGQTSRLSEKRELVILLKPTIVDPSQEDSELRRDALQRLLDWTDTQPVLKPAKTEAPRAAVSQQAVPAHVSTPTPTPTPPPAASAPTAAVMAPQAEARAPAPTPDAKPPALSFADMGRTDPAPSAPPPASVSTMNWAAMAQAFGGSVQAVQAVQAAAANANNRPAVQTAAVTRPLPGYPAAVAGEKPSVVGAGAPTTVNPLPKAVVVASPAARTPGFPVAPQAPPPSTPSSTAVQPVPGLPSASPLVPSWLGAPKAAEAGWFKPVSRFKRVPTLAANADWMPKHQGAPPSG
jgi:hypothetical protein